MAPTTRHQDALIRPNCDAPDQRSRAEKIEHVRALMATFQPPTTQDTASPFYTSEADWQAEVLKIVNARDRKSMNIMISNHLDTRDKARRIMETTDGASPKTACTTCIQKGYECRVSADTSVIAGDRCAACIIKRGNTKACNAQRGDTPKKPSASRNNNVAVDLSDSDNPNEMSFEDLFPDPAERDAMLKPARDTLNKTQEGRVQKTTTPKAKKTHTRNTSSIDAVIAEIAGNQPPSAADETLAQSRAKQLQADKDLILAATATAKSSPISKGSGSGKKSSSKPISTPAAPTPGKRFRDFVGDADSPSITSSMFNVSSDVNELRAEVADISTAIHQLDQKHNALITRCDKLCHTIKGMDSMFTVTEHHIRALNNNYANMKRDVNTNQADINAIKAKMDEDTAADDETSVLLKAARTEIEDMQATIDITAEDARKANARSDRAVKDVYAALRQIEIESKRLLSRINLQTNQQPDVLQQTLDANQTVGAAPTDDNPTVGLAHTDDNQTVRLAQTYDSQTVGLAQTDDNSLGAYIDLNQNPVDSRPVTAPPTPGGGDHGTPTA